MTNSQGDFPLNTQTNSSESEFVRRASMPLYSARGWMKFVGIIMIIGGIPSAIGLVGIIPIWQGDPTPSGCFLSGNSSQHWPTVCF